MASGHAAVMEEGGFTIVSGRSSRRGSSRPLKQLLAGHHQRGSEPGRAFRPALLHTLGPASASDLHALSVRVDAALEELRGSALMSRLRHSLGSLTEPSCDRPVPRAIVCLGLGSFATAAAPRYQMALALLLREELLGLDPAPAHSAQVTPGHRSSAGGSVGEGGGPNQPVTDLDSFSGGELSAATEAAPGLCPRFCAYDPVFDALERAFLHSRGCAVLTRNHEGRHTAHASHGCTLFFMPHCGRQLYSNLLTANWGAETLARLLILGNSLTSYAGLPGTDRAAAWSALFRALPLLSETRIGPPAGGIGGRRPSGEASGDGAAEMIFANAFNNTSLHAFDPQSTRAMGPAWWKRPFEPPPAHDPLLSLDIVAAEAGGEASRQEGRGVEGSGETQRRRADEEGDGEGS